MGFFPSDLNRWVDPGFRTNHQRRMSQILVCVYVSLQGYPKKNGDGCPFPFPLESKQQNTFIYIYIICMCVPLIWKKVFKMAQPIPYHLWYIYLHLVDFYGNLVGKTTKPRMLWEWLHLSLNDSPRVLALPGAHDFPVHMMAGLQES